MRESLYVLYQMYYVSYVQMVYCRWYVYKSRTPEGWMREDLDFRTEAKASYLSFSVVIRSQLSHLRLNASMEH